MNLFRHICRQRLIVVAAFLALVSVKEAVSATFTWDGGGSGGNRYKWSKKQNWNNLDPVSAATSDFVFTGNTNTNGPQQEFANPLICNSISFNSAAGSFTLTGNQIRFSGASSGIFQNSSNAQQIDNALNLNTATTFGGNGAGIITIGGAITGSAALTKSGNSTFILTGNNSFSGGLTISGGTLQGNTASLPGNIVNNANLVFNQTSDGTYAGALSGSGTLIKQNTGLLRLTGNNNSFSGAITVSGGTLQVGHASALGTAGGSTVVSSGAVLDLAGYNIGTEPVSLTGGALANSSASTSQLAGALTVTSNSSFSGTGDFIFSGAIGGTGSLTKNSNNTATLSGATANTMSGIFTVNTGMIVLDKTGVRAIAGDLTVAGGTVRIAGTGDDQISDSALVTLSSGTLDVNNRTETIGALVGGGNLVLGTGMLIIADGNGANFTGSITGTGSLTKAGAGTQFLSGVNLYGGPTTINGGALAVGSDNNLGSGTGPANIVINGGTLLATNTFILSSARGIAVGATNTTWDTGTISVSAGKTLTFNGVIANNGTVSGVAGGLAKDGDGTLILGGNNTYTGGTFINSGTVQAGANNVLAPTSAITVSSGAVLDVGAYEQVVGSMAGDGVIVNRTALITGSNGVSAVFRGTITGNGSLTKIGSGIQELTAANNFTGGTVINGGTVLVNNTTGSALGTGAVTVNSGGTLGGTGTVAGVVTVNSGGRLAAGNSVGTQSYGGWNLKPNSHLDVEFKSDASANDRYIVNNVNGLSIGSGVKVNLYKENTIPPTPFTDLGLYQLVNYSGAIGGTGLAGLSVNNPAINRSYSFGILSGTTNWITLTIGGRGVGWVGAGADADWNTLGNWQTNGVPYSIQALDQLVFDGTTKENNNNNFTAGTQFNGIIFTNTAGAFILNGNRVNLLGDIVNRSANTQTINLDLVLDGSTRTVNTANGNIVINGVVSQSGGTQGLIKTGNNTLVLAGNNTYQGETEIAGGVLRANDGAGLPTLSHLKISAGVLESIGAASFSRNLGTLSGQFQWNGSGGFAAKGGKLTVTVNNNAADTMIWNGTSGFLRNGEVLVFGSASSDGEVEFRNPVNFNGAARTVQVTGGGYATMSGTLSGSGSAGLTKTGSGHLVLAGNNTYSGATTISDGKLTVNGTLSGGGSAVTVASGATLAGRGRIARQITGAGAVDPGSSPGILTVNQVDPSSGMDFNFEFTNIGSPNYLNAGASLNDVLRMTDGTPFTVSLTAENTVNLYLNASLVIGTNYFRGGFYTDANADFLATIQNAGFNVYATGGSGGASYNGVGYTYLPGSLVLISTVNETGPGGVTGRVMQFGVNFEGWAPPLLAVPEPSVLMLWFGGLFTIYAAHRRNKKGIQKS
jgi:autotransporter-associated beta strand protein